MENKKITELIPDDKNFNKGTEEGQKLLNESFKDYGAGRSILLDKNGKIIAGNKSTLAAIEAGIENVKIIEVDDSELVAVKRKDVDIDSEKGRKLALLDNLTSQVNLAWDEEMLHSVADELDDFDITKFGFEEPKLDNGEVLDDEYDVDEPVPSRCQNGDIWILGRHRLMCGDSTKAEDVAKLMEGEVADLLLTDPPYNVGLGYEGCATQQRCACRSAESKTILNDKMSSSAFKDFMKNVIINAKNNIKKGAPYYIFYATSETLNVVSAVHEVQEMSLRQILIWVKDSIVMGRQDYQWKYEPCLYGWKEGAAHNFYADRKQSTILEFSRPKVSKEHPTMKPVPLFAYLMSNSTKEGEVVFDAFGGSGTTLIAAEQLNRKARLMELDPHYCDVIINRWEELTKNKAIKK